MRLIPRDTKFFDLFADISGNLTEGAKLLRGILADPYDLAMRVSQVQAIEHKGDKATHAIITKLNQTFITPFDREDIHRLASSLDDVLDFVNSAALRLVMYKIVTPPPVFLFKTHHPHLLFEYFFIFLYCIYMKFKDKVVVQQK